MYLFKIFKCFRLNKIAFGYCHPQTGRLYANHTYITYVDTPAISTIEKICFTVYSIFSLRKK